MKKFLALVIAVIAMAMFSGCAIVGPGEKGVVVELGKVDMEKVLGEGPHLINPFVTSVKMIDCQLQKHEFPCDAATKDLQTVNTTVAVNWKLEAQKVNTIYQSIGSLDEVVRDVMHPAVNEVVKAAAAKQNAESILTERETLKKTIDDALKVRLAPYGVVVNDVSLINFTFSNDFQKAIEEKQVAEQNAKKAIYVAKQAEAEAQGVINKARGDAESFRLKAMSITSQMLQLEQIKVQQTMAEKWDGKYPQYMGTGNAIPLMNVGVK
jgi:regulator of protease activity HflC (stomatin/prohibitin superfamily)